MDHLINFYQSYNDVSEYHLLIIPTYNYIYEIELKPNLSFLHLHKVLSRHNIFIKSDFIIKISGMCIDYIFRNHSMFIKIIMFGKYIKETMNQCT